MDITSGEALCALLARSRLVSSDEAHSLFHGWRRETGHTADDARAFASWLIAGRFVTDYQAAALLRGNSRFFLNDYKLLDRIGSGRMAGVYRAVHRLGQTVAVKVLPQSKAKDATTLGRFQREARLSVKLKHPNVVRTFQVGEDGGLNYLVMEYLDGETLEEVLKRRGKLPITEAVRLIHQALGGLQHLHQQDMVHRDIKPGNLMLVPSAEPGEADNTDQATVKILDVGLGRATFDEGTAVGEELTAKGDLVGTVDYMAPEQAADARRADIRSDIYSVGCVLYQCLTGKVPFPATNVVQAVTRHAREAPKPLKASGIVAPDALQAVLDAMLAKDPARRYATPEQAGKALEPHLQAGGAELVTPEADPRMRPYLSWLEEQAGALVAAAATAKRASRSPVGVAAIALVGVAAVFLLLALGVGVALWLGGRRQPTPDAIPPIAEIKDAKPGDHSSEELFEKWVERVAGLKGEQQLAEVVARLRKHNPDFDGNVKQEAPDGMVRTLEFVTDQLTDVRPVQVLQGLYKLVCTGSGPGKGKLVDLSPLKDLNLAVLDCGSNPVEDLSPLKQLPLLYLGIGGTRVRDLSPLAGMPLNALNCAGTSVRDLSPLRGMELTYLDASGTPVDDLSPLRNMPLQSLWCGVQPRRDAAWLRSLTKLKAINGNPAMDVLKTIDAEQQSLEGWAKSVRTLPPGRQAEEVVKKLIELNPGLKTEKVKVITDGGAVVALALSSDDVVDLSPVRGLPKLRRLDCHASGKGRGKLSSLHALSGLALTDLDCADHRIADLKQLTGLKLTLLNLGGNAPLDDLTPLREMKLTWLNIAGTRVRDLAPLKDMPLTYLACHDTQVQSLVPLQGKPLTYLTCDVRPLRDLPVLRSLKALARLNDRPWQDFDKACRDFEAWTKEVAGLPADTQSARVRDKLKELNAAFQEKTFAVTAEGNAVTELKVSAVGVTDLSPVRALPRLRKLECTGKGRGTSALTDLWPLSGLPVKDLSLAFTAVNDLSPLKNAPLEHLDLTGTPVTDLAPLRKLKLVSLNVTGTGVTDLTPLTGLTSLRDVKGDFRSDWDAETLAPLQKLNLTGINGRPAADFWKPEAKAPTGAKAPAAVARKPAVKPVSQFQGKLRELNPKDRTLRLRVTQSIVVQNPGAAWEIVRHQQGIAAAMVLRDPFQRNARIQDHMFWIAYHQQNLYTHFEQNKTLTLQAAKDARVRVLQLPLRYDNGGNIRQPTAQEKRELQDAELTKARKKEVYKAEFRDLQIGDLVEVSLAPIDPDRLPTNAPAMQAPLEVVLIVVVIKGQ
jgi:Leucine-rich repeat (LRR) protein